MIINNDPPQLDAAPDPEEYPLHSNGDCASWVSEPKENPIKDKSFAFALLIIKLCRYLQDQHEYVISKQLLRSGTSIGANIEEATAAESRRDFIHKMKIAMKEARETHYWLRLINESSLVNDLDVSDYLSEADELSRMLTSITKTAIENARAMKR
jgi:four helix bundle protein